MTYSDAAAYSAAGATPTSALAADLNRETDSQCERIDRILIYEEQADGSFVLPAQSSVSSLYTGIFFLRACGR